MPPVQQTTLMRIRDEKTEEFIKQLKKEIITSALTELDEAKE